MSKTGMKRFDVNIPMWVMEKLRKIREEFGKVIGEFIREAITEKLARDYKDENIKKPN